MEHVVFDEVAICPECGKKSFVTGKVLGVPIADWNGSIMKITLYYTYCPECCYYKIVQ